MTLWISFALLTIIVLACLLRPLLRRISSEYAPAECDLAVYKDQLVELDREVADGLLDADLAAAARTEIQRRILGRAADSTAPAASRSRRRARLVVAAGLFLGVPLGAVALYGDLGAPQLKGQPFAGRQNDPDFAMARMVDHLSARLRAKPDAAGYATLAESLFTLKRYDEAIEAFRRAIGMGVADPEMMASLGEAYVLTNDGAVTPEAQQAFQHALMLDRSAPRSRFYLGLAHAQIGQFREAVSIWRDLEKDSPAESPWLPMLREHIRAFAEQGGFDPASVPPMPPGLPAAGATMGANPHLREGGPPAMTPPPSQGEPSATAPSEPVGIASLTDEQAQQVHVMVDGLAERLKQDPDNFDGWIRLARSYTVLGDLAKALPAARHAVSMRPDSVDAKLSLADVQLAAGKDHRLPDDYIATMKDVLALDPVNVRALYAMGAAALQNGHADEARDRWTRLLDLLPADAPERTRLNTQIATLPKN
jgi:cytochrome c-type biogenesis protein CcmH